jgi:transcription initiation factor TFIID subunit 1
MEEDSVIQTLTGFDLDNVLTSLSLPAGSVSNQLGISGVPALDRGQIYNDNWDDGAVGAGEGDDWEDEVDRELQAEGDLDAPPVKMELDSPGVKPKQKRIRTIRRLIERPKTVYERFPDFHQGKVLDFTELFKGKTVQKSRLTKRPFSGMFESYPCPPFSRSLSKLSHSMQGEKSSRISFWMQSLGI